MGCGVMDDPSIQIVAAGSNHVVHARRRHTPAPGARTRAGTRPHGRVDSVRVAGVACLLCFLVILWAVWHGWGGRRITLKCNAASVSACHLYLSSSATFTSLSS